MNHECFRYAACTQSECKTERQFKRRLVALIHEKFGEKVLLKF